MCQATTHIKSACLDALCSRFGDCRCGDKGNHIYACPIQPMKNSKKSKKAKRAQGGDDEGNEGMEGVTLK